MGTVNGEVVVHYKEIPSAHQVLLVFDVGNHTIDAAHAVALAQFPGGDTEGASEWTAAAGLEKLEPHPLFPQEFGLASIHIPIDQFQVGDRVDIMGVGTVRVVADVTVVTSK